MVVIDNKLASRINVLAKESKRTFTQQLEVMVETFEIMPIRNVTYLPSPIGGHQVQVVEVSGQVITGREASV